MLVVPDQVSTAFGRGGEGITLNRQQALGFVGSSEEEVGGVDPVILFAVHHLLAVPVNDPLTAIDPHLVPLGFHVSIELFLQVPTGQDVRGVERAGSLLCHRFLLLFFIR